MIPVWEKPMEGTQKTPCGIRRVPHARRPKGGDSLMISVHPAERGHGTGHGRRHGVADLREQQHVLVHRQQHVVPVRPQQIQFEGQTGIRIGPNHGTGESNFAQREKRSRHRVSGSHTSIACRSARGPGASRARRGSILSQEYREG